MRLLYFNQSGELKWEVFSNNIPRYAILSHTWDPQGPIVEFTYEDLVKGTGKDKASFQKIVFCGQQAARDQIQYFWVDTCCIDRWNLSELSNEINSMFRFYHDAAKCYVYMSDVSEPVCLYKIGPEVAFQKTKASFRKSRWFRRGWTLQELIAPVSVEFFSSTYQWLGDKNSLEQVIHEITNVPVEALRRCSLSSFSVEERMAWADHRVTTEEEDGAYCLMGLFGVKMPLMYGEGKVEALRRLHWEMQPTESTSFIVPFGKNNQFTGRKLELAKLEEALFVDGQTTKVAITGAGGIGKTQLALELAYRTKQTYQDCLVLWIPASDMESVQQAYVQIAQRLQIPGWDDEKLDVKKLVQIHLSKESTGRWLFILDSADDDSMWTAGAGGLIDHLPTSEQGCIIFTTRDKKLADRLAPQTVVEVPEMDAGMAQMMLERHLFHRGLIDEHQADLLLKELAYFPLAIVLASAYIIVNNLDLKDYRTLLKSQDEETVGFLSRELKDEWQAHDGTHPLVIPWLISFEKIRSRDALAAEYLSFMACIDHRDIPLSLLPRGPSYEEEKGALRMLADYSIVIRRPAGSALDVHQLVQLATQNWLRKHNSLSQQTEAALTHLNDVFPDENYLNRSKWRRLLPHANHALKLGAAGEENRAWTGLLWKCAMSSFSDGRWNEAEELLSKALEAEKMLLGDEHIETLITMANLASTYRNQGRWKEAEELEVKVKDTRKRLLGGEHLDTLTSMSNLALTLSNQGRWKEAEELEVQVKDTSLRMLGEDHPLTLTSIANLASTFSDQGRWKEAEELEVQVKDMSKRILGEEHPDTLASITNLASTYRNQGRWKEAEELEVQVKDTSLRVLGENHPFTLTSMANLASTFWNQGRWKEAEELFVYVTDIRKSVLGEEHPSTLTSMGNLALTYSNQGRWKEAEELGVQVKDIRKRVLGEDHPDTLTSIANLALTVWNQGRWKEAEELEVQVKDTRKRVLGENHPDTLTSIVNLASTYRNQGRWNEAEELQAKELEVCSRIQGKEHPSTLISMGNLASTYRNQGRWKEAEELEVQVKDTSVRVLGEDHPDTLTSMANLASTYRNQGRWKEAEELLVQIKDTRKRVLGEEHPSTLTSMGNLALTFWDQGRWKEAEELEVQVKDTSVRVLGEDHPDTLTSMASLASTYRNQGRWNEAEELQAKELEVCSRVQGKEHPSTLISMANLAYIWKGQGRDSDALQLMKQCLELRIKVLGETHPHTLSTTKTLRQWSGVDMDSSTSIVGHSPTSGDE